jgi:hypothetical protein
LSSRWRLTIYWGILIGFVVVLVVGAGEILLRLAQPPRASSDIEYVNRNGYWVYPPGRSFHYVNERDETVVIETDDLGYRNPPNAQSEADVLVLGDSFVAAVSTPDGETFVDVIRLLGHSAYNAGMDGTGTFHQVEALRDLVALVEPNVIVWAFYLGNDFRDNYWSGLSAASAARQSDDAAQTGRIGNWRARLEAASVGIPCGPSLLCGWVRDQLFVGIIAGKGRDPMGSYAQAEMIMLRRDDAQARLATRETAAALGAAKGLVEDYGARLLVVGIPSKAQVLRSFREISGFENDPKAMRAAKATFLGEYSWRRPDRLLAEICWDLDIRYLSLLDVFRASAEQGLYFELDAHWARAGQRAAAEAVSPLLRRLGDASTWFEPDLPAESGTRE